MYKLKSGAGCVALSCLLVSMSGPLRAIGQQDQRSVTVKQVVNQEGWEIPGLLESEIIDPRQRLPTGYGVQSVPLQITVLRPKRGLLETVSLYGTKDGGQTVVVRERRVAVRSIIKCDVNKNVFLYIVQFGMVVYDSASKNTSHSGLFGLLYYDNDGDGVFESRESGPFVVTPDLRIPDWALKNPASP